jgi:hypothetical protein
MNNNTTDSFIEIKIKEYKKTMKKIVDLERQNENLKLENDDIQKFALEKYKEIKNGGGKKKIIYKTGTDIENDIKNLLKDDNYDIFNINKNTETDQKNVVLDSDKVEKQKSETSLVSSIFKKKTKSDFEKKQNINKNMSLKYSQSPSYSEPNTIKKIKNTINVTETIQGGNISSSESESKSKNNSTEESTNSKLPTDNDWSDSSVITSISESDMYETLDDETVTTMTDDDKKKTYKRLSKEMKYFETIKKVNKYDIQKYNFILNGLDILNKYKK